MTAKQKYLHFNNIKRIQYNSPVKTSVTNHLRLYNLPVIAVASFGPTVEPAAIVASLQAAVDKD